jgi:hypothetical protein|tara:strand:- start:165 stop:482 length:318 start_codon:yes stop_codon:yes gene_type:complete
MKKIKLTETELTKIIKKVVNEQNSAFDWESSLDGWDIQKAAEEDGKYCSDSSPFYFEGQYCSVETNWYDWESQTSVKVTGQSHGGRWKCGVGCVIPKGESGRWGN